MEVRLIVKCGGSWLEPPLLDEPQLFRAMNAAAVLTAKILKGGELSFNEGAAVRLLADGKAIFSGRVFTKRRSCPEVIEITAYDELRYLQNRDCCVFKGATPADMVKRMAAALELATGDLAAVDWRLSVRVFDNRRYIDMLTAVLAEVLADRHKHYVVLAENGRLCLRDCRDMQVDICLELGSIGGYEYKTSIDEGYANRVKLIYEDRRRALRREFVADDRAAIKDYGVLQYVHKSAAVAEETTTRAKERLRELKQRCDELKITGALGDVAVRGGSVVWVKMDLGDKIVNSQALVKSSRLYFKSGVCLMDVVLDCSLF